MARNQVLDRPIIALQHNGKTSYDFGAVVNSPFNLVHAKRDVSGTSVPGVNGGIIEDNQHYNDVTQTITFTVYRPSAYPGWEALEEAWLDWLQPTGDYTTYEPFGLNFLEPYHLLAYLSEAPVWTLNQTLEAAQVVVTLTCKPYLVKNDRRYERVPTVVTNQSLMEAAPLWHIKGSGDFTLQINDRKYELNPVDDEVYIDSTRFLVYKDLQQYRGTIAKFPNNDFPVLPHGKNTISLTGTYSLFEYKPRWRRLL